MSTYVSTDKFWATLTSEGTVKVPANIRDAWKLNPGDDLALTIRGAKQSEQLKMSLPPWMLEAYNRYLTETEKKKKKKTSLEKMIEALLESPKFKIIFKKQLEEQTK